MAELLTILLCFGNMRYLLWRGVPDFVLNPRWPTLVQNIRAALSSGPGM